MPGLTIRGHGVALNDRGAAAADKRNETFLRAGSAIYDGDPIEMEP
ncbi:MAG: hypothetical protein K2L82_16765 [Lachnospiraceae bacterium]|nr:hypothetical protein [Lachnospiraceae bacterium]